MYAFLFIAFLAKLDQLMSIFKHFRMKRASLLQDSTKAFTTSLLSLNYRSWIIDETYKVQMYVEFCVERMMLQKLILFVKKTFRDKKQAKPSHAARLVQEQKIKFESQKIVFFLSLSTKKNWESICSEWPAVAATAGTKHSSKTFLEIFFSILTWWRRRRGGRWWAIQIRPNSCT